ncbi:VQ motif-containing protein 19 [Manihot esculenta]|uniref:VQ domain-containing protein n=1 Tax=Manihot esculenta TaxID=3983 RepID=A0A2C9W6C4_MANES|nr:VQ motif-containing protein 19 [Manihot esculenta]OAY54880.1 hypothetical protein MANES_03G109400v8 [Manihot esculenta]
MFLCHKYNKKEYKTKRNQNLQIPPFNTLLIKALFFTPPSISYSFLHSLSQLHFSFLVAVVVSSGRRRRGQLGREERTNPAMETSTRLQESRNPSPINSPHSNGSNNGVQIHTPPLTPIPISRSDSNPYPTTFVQADTSTFKQVVQMLTGSTETAKQASSRTAQDQPPPPTTPTSTATTRNFTIPPIKSMPKKQQNSFKLYERRNNNLKNSLMINTLLPSFASNNSVTGFSPRNKQEILSPSWLDFPKLTLSPVTPLNNEDPFYNSSPSLGNSSSEEERAIAEKGFYLHPSPISTPRDSEPQLLPLFPVTSPKVSGS